MRSAIVLATALGVLVLPAAGPAGAQPTCDGVPATIVARPGQPTFGTDGPDVIVGTPGRDLIDARGGDDLVCGEGDTDLIFGGDGDDTLYGGQGDSDWLFGEGGDDLLDGGPGDADAPAYSTRPIPVSVDLQAGVATGDGTDTLVNMESITGSSEDDELFGDDADNGFLALGGDDLVDGREGDDEILFFASEQGMVVHLEGGTALGEGVDTLRSIEWVVGSHHDDLIVGEGGPNTIFGLEGDDELWGRGDDDILAGGQGDDRLFGGAGTADSTDYFDARAPVTVDLAQGTARGGGGRDSLLGVEWVFGSAFDDVLRGDEAENVFSGGGGADLMDGREGYDVVAYVGSTPEVDTITLDTGPVEADLALGQGVNHGDPGAPVDTFSSIEGLLGSDRGDELKGDGGPNLLAGLDGDDLLVGRGGDDYFNGGPGADEYRGGPGQGDTANYSFEDRRVRANLALGTATVGGETDALRGVEIVVGGQKRDRLRGGPRFDFLIGEGGPDDLRGRRGNDVLDGGKGRDFLDGGPGFDSCLTRPNQNCESSELPPDLRDELRLLNEQRDRDDRLRKAKRKP